MPKVFIKTYGCQMNERDSEQVARMFEQGGYTITSLENDADVILLNTCSVRDQAEQKAIGKMGILGRQRKHKPHVVFGFMGCMAQSRGEELFAKIPHLDVVVGTQKYHRVFEYVDNILSKRLQARMDDQKLAFYGQSVIDVEEESGSQNTIRDHRGSEHPATAFVSIMQGCNMKCSFCIVPYTRGSERSRPIEDIVAEVSELAAKGVKEITLLGQIVNQYGRGLLPYREQKSPFVQLLEAVHAIEGIERIRFTSPHPIGFRDDLIACFGYLPKLCPHMHFPMQSGSDRVLKLMRRPYQSAKFLEICRKVREVRPDIAITTDVIVGFPGESEEDYLQTREMMRQIEFDNAFIFRYSKRKGTPAAEMDGQIEEAVKERRNQDLLAMCNEIIIRKNAALVGSIQQVLIDGRSKTNENTLSARTPHNKLVIIKADARWIGSIVNVRISESSGFTLYGEIID